MALISEVTPIAGHRLMVKLADGRVAVVDYSDKLGTCRFCALADEDTFSNVTTDGVFIIWGNGKVRVSASELYTYVQKSQAI